MITSLFLMLTLSFTTWPHDYAHFLFSLPAISSRVAAINDGTYSFMPTPTCEHIQNTFYSGYCKGHCCKISITCSSLPGLFRIWAMDLVTPKVADIDACREMDVTHRIKGRCVFDNC